MPFTLSDEEVKMLKKALEYQQISHKAYFENNVLFRAMKDSGDFEKVVAEPLKALLMKNSQWTEKDEAEMERMHKSLLEKAQEGKTPEEWYKNAKKALDKEFRITGKDIVVAAGSLAALGTVIIVGGKIARALSSGKAKKKTGE